MDRSCCSAIYIRKMIANVIALSSPSSVHLGTMQKVILVAKVQLLFTKLVLLSVKGQHIVNKNLTFVYRKRKVEYYWN